MTKTSVTILLGFVLMFAAGAVIGMVKDKAVPPASPHNHSWLADQLQLTDQQREQMKEIWQSAMPHQHGDQAMEKRRTLQKERDDAIRAMLNSDQQAKFDAIEQKYEQSIADLQKNRAKAVQDAVERTKLILNDQQRQKYDELRKHWEADRANGESSRHPATMPSGNT